MPSSCELLRGRVVIVGVRRGATIATIVREAVTHVWASMDLYGRQRRRWRCTLDCGSNTTNMLPSSPTLRPPSPSLTTITVPLHMVVAIGSIVNNMISATATATATYTATAAALATAATAIVTTFATTGAFAAAAVSALANGIWEDQCWTTCGWERYAGGGATGSGGPGSTKAMSKVSNGMFLAEARLSL